MFATFAIVVLILGASAVVVWRIYRRHPSETAEPMDWGQRLRLAGAHTYRLAGLARAGLHELWQRFQAWRDRDATPQPAAAPAPAAPRLPSPRRPAGPPPAFSDGGALTPVPLDVTRDEVPAAFVPLIEHISGFEAAEDADLQVFTRGLAAGELATGEALQHQLEHCVTAIGLDPVSVQGLADYAEQKAEHAQGAMQIWQRFAAVYAEVQAFIADGGVLPKDGNFLTGES